MKKILILIISALMMLSLFGCAEEKYPPVESTAEESRVVMTLSIEGEKYEVKYELYRALFLNNKSRVDGGDSSVWTSAESKGYVDEINAIITERLSEIFSVIHLAKEIGFDPYSEKVDLEIEEYIIGAVEGDENQLGHGSYKKYLESLKKNNLNYSTAVFMLRYALADEAIDKYYLGEYDEIAGQKDGEYKYTKADVEKYYFSNDSARVLQSYFPAGIKTAAQMTEYRNSLIGIKDVKSIAAYIIGSTTATESDLIKDGEVSGIMIGKNEISGSEYAGYITEIFELEAGELSPVIYLENTNADGYYLIYALEKNAEHFEKFYPSIRNSYLNNIVGKVLGNMSAALCEKPVFTEEYKNINHALISME